MRVTLELCTNRFRPRNASGTVSSAPQLTMSSAPTETTCGMPVDAAAVSRSGPAENTPPTRLSASSVVVTSQHAVDVALPDEGLHGPPAGPGHVEHQHLVAEFLEAFPGARHARRRDAEHARRHQRLRVGDLRDGRREQHARDRRSGIAEHHGRDAVEPGDVDDARREDEIGLADVLLGVARGGGRHDEPREAERQIAERGRREGGAAGAAEGQCALHTTVVHELADDGCRAEGHCGHRDAAIRSGDEGVQVGATGSGHLTVRDVGLEARAPEDAEVDDDGVEPLRMQAIAHECVFGALRIEGSQQHDGGGHHWLSPERGG